ncbi:hypothetical protein E4U44_007452 [Claviceps purpurea]|nr:hypothetical protein E4U44_007452 [Claviceps purpurea]
MPLVVKEPYKGEDLGIGPLTTIFGAFGLIVARRLSECAEYIPVRQRPRFLPGGITPAIRPPFVVEDFIQILVTAFMPKDLAARAQKMVHAIQQGPAQPLSLFLGDYNKWCTRAGHLAPTGAARIEIHKGGLNDFIRTASASSPPSSNSSPPS